MPRPRSSAAAVLVAALGWAASVLAEEAPVALCTKTFDPGPLEPIQEEIRALPEGSTVCLRPGTYAGSLWLAGSISIRGMGRPEETVLDAGGRKSVVTVARPEDAGDRRPSGPVVSISGVTLRNGSIFDAGGAVSVRRGTEVTLQDCVLESSRGRTYGGGGLFADRAKVTFRRVVLRNNEGDQGGAVLVSGGALAMEDCLVHDNRGKYAAAIEVKEAAGVSLSRCTIARNWGGPQAIEARASTTSAPSLLLSECVLDGGVKSLSEETRVTVRRSVLPESERERFKGNDNRFGDALLGADFRPAPDSPARGLGSGGGADLRGAPRPASGAAAGALE